MSTTGISSGSAGAISNCFLQHLHLLIIPPKYASEKEIIEMTRIAVVSSIVLLISLSTIFRTPKMKETTKINHNKYSKDDKLIYVQNRDII
jgi:hypothetical protein